MREQEQNAHKKVADEERAGTGSAPTLTHIFFSWLIVIVCLVPIGSAAHIVPTLRAGTGSAPTPDLFCRYVIVVDV